MSTRFILAGILGGIAMFIWSAIAHMVLPLGEAGIKELPNESALLGALGSNIGQGDGLYLFPGLGLPPEASTQQRHEAMRNLGDRYAQNPSGFLVYHPAGRAMQMGRWLGVEFLVELAEAFLLVALIARSAIYTFGVCLRTAFLAGILAAITTNISYWNWYGFPGLYTCSYMSIQVIGFLCAGIVAGLVLGRNRAAAVS